MYGLYWVPKVGTDEYEAPKAFGTKHGNQDTPQPPNDQVQGLPEYPALLEFRAQELIGKIKGRTILEISGIGGVGKTTLAKQIFNTLSPKFDRTCFLENVKGIPGHKLKKRLEDRFRSGGRTFPFDWSKVRNKNTLMVLDDVDSEDQLKVLPKLDHFGNETCLIITTRNKGILEVYEDCVVHEVDSLDDYNAKQLFCQHAFGSIDIPDSVTERNLMEDYVKAVVTKSGGLPLTLEVLGRFLRGQEANTNVWEETIDKLGKAEAIPDQDHRVLASLRVSYDALSEEEQEMLGDAATFYFKRPFHKALVVWSTFSKNSDSNWANLLSRSMVKEVWNGNCTEIWVHEQLRDLIKSIGNSKMVSGNGDDAKLLVDMLNGNQVDADIKSVRLSDVTGSPELQLYTLAKLKKLKFVELDTVAISPTRTIPINLSEIAHLAVLELQNCEVPEDFAEALGGLSSLCSLSLGRLKGLKFLPESFGQLSKLTSLELASLGPLTLPQSIGKLSSLQYLLLRDLECSKLPESLGNLSSLLTLKIENMGNLAVLPKSFGHHIMALKLFTIWNCPNLKYLPKSFGGGLPCLETVTIGHCDKLQRLPECFSELSGLRQLSINNCTKLKELTNSFGNLSALRKLHVHNDDLQRLPESFGLLSALEDFSVSNGRFPSPRRFESLPENFGQLKALRKLYISNDTLETIPESFCFLTSLRELELSCEKVTKLPQRLGQLSQLEKLHITVGGMDDLPEGVENMASLRDVKIYFSGVGLVRQPPTIYHPYSFNRLDIRNPECKIVPKNLWKIASLEGRLSPLSTIIIDCDSLKELPEDWGKLASLEHLNIGAGRVENLPESIGELRSLKMLVLKTPLLRSVPKTVAQLSSLKELSFECDGHEEMPQGFGDFPFAALKLSLTGKKTRVLPPLGDILNSLKDLNIHFMPLKELPEDFIKLSSLERLSLECCDGLENLPDCLGEMESLKELHLSLLMELKTLPETLGLLGDRNEVEGNEEMSQTGASKRFRLELGYCPLLYESLESLGWVSVPGDSFRYYERK